MKRDYEKISVFLLSILVIGGMGASASADYKWIDEEGVIHLTGDFQKIPESYRSQAEKVEPPPPSRAPSMPAPSLPPKEEVDSQGHGKEWWRNRVKEWEGKRDRVTARIGELNLEFTDLQSKMITLGERIQERNRISQEIGLEEEKKREAERTLNDVLPEEARKAGAPPGWLREPGK